MHWQPLVGGGDGAIPPCREGATGGGGVSAGKGGSVTLELLNTGIGAIAGGIESGSISDTSRPSLMGSI